MFVHILRTIDQRRVKVYIFERVSSLEFQKFQNQSHSSYKNKLLQQKLKFDEMDQPYVTSSTSLVHVFTARVMFIVEILTLVWL